MANRDHDDLFAHPAESISILILLCLLTLLGQDLQILRDLGGQLSAEAKIGLKIFINSCQRKWLASVHHRFWIHPLLLGTFVVDEVDHHLRHNDQLVEGQVVLKNLIQVICVDLLHVPAREFIKLKFKKKLRNL